jgi:hypothetical protein
MARLGPGRGLPFLFCQRLRSTRRHADPHFVEQPSIEERRNIEPRPSRICINRSMRGWRSRFRRPSQSFADGDTVVVLFDAGSLCVDGKLYRSTYSCSYSRGPVQVPLKLAWTMRRGMAQTECQSNGLSFSLMARSSGIGRATALASESASAFVSGGRDGAGRQARRRADRRRS